MNVVKELMGHSDISTTAEFYNTVGRDHERKAARVVQRLLDRNKSDSPIGDKKIETTTTTSALYTVG
jgi:hypothetical protein